MESIDLGDVQSRPDMIRLFDGYAEERISELSQRALKRPLVKTHMLEIMGGGQSQNAEGLIGTFARRNVRLEQMDDTLFRVFDRKNGYIGFLEQLKPRIVALYSVVSVKDLIPWVQRLVLGSPELDHVWLSGLTFGVLWDTVVELSQPRRYSRLAFTHDSIFTINGEPAPAGEDDEGEGEEPADDEDLGEIRERRAASFRLVDRVGIINEKLKRLQDIYSPLYAISQLRFPSSLGSGGHDFYDDGRVTNRSSDFRNHRSHVSFVVDIYDELLRQTESEAWYSIRESVEIPGQFRKIVGAPVVIRFGETLSPQVFEHFIDSTFRHRNRFRLWGHPIRLGPTKVHVYGVDCHLWQPLFLEITAAGCTAIIPNGTCGNTVHRLVTNIQRFVAPGATVYIGEKAYSEVVRESRLRVHHGVGA